MIALSSPDGVPAEEAVGLRLLFGVGAVVQWRGQAWIITADHSHPRWGRFFRLERPSDGAYDLVHANGSDGAIEALGPSA